MITEFKCQHCPLTFQLSGTEADNEAISSHRKRHEFMCQYCSYTYLYTGADADFQVVYEHIQTHSERKGFEELVNSKVKPQQPVEGVDFCKDCPGDDFHWVKHFGSPGTIQKKLSVWEKISAFFRKLRKKKTQSWIFKGE